MDKISEISDNGKVAGNIGKIAVVQKGEKI